MRDLYIKNGQGFIIVFSLTSRQSFQDIKLIREQILRVKGTNRVPIVLAANKFDIVETHREVDTDEGCRLANEWMVPYMETSAKNSSIVNTLFTEIVKEMNFKSTSHGSSGRKEKKKFKMLNNMNVSSNIGNRANLSNNSSHSFTSNPKESTAKFKKADYDAHLSSCSFFNNCTKCFCVRSSPNKSYSATNRSSNSFYGQETSNRCSILWANYSFFIRVLKSF